MGAIPDGMVGQEIPKQQYLYYRHEGTLEEIAASFGKMYDWAKKNGYATGSFKLDIGYTGDQSEKVHDLYIKVLN